MSHASQNINEKYMRLAMKLALKAKGQTSPNPLVGAVVVKNNQAISSGYHHRCGAPHAEVMALKKAGLRAKGAQLYVTLEPCSHHGRTPPCLDTIIQSGIKEVIIGTKDPNPINNGRSIQSLKRLGIKTKVGFLRDELMNMNEPFIKYITKKMPFVVAKWAQTIDGKIATITGQSKWITSKKTRDFSHKLRNDFDAILVGANTVLKDDPHLNVAKKSKLIKKIIVDSTLKISPNASLFKRTRPQDVILATTKDASKAKLKIFTKKRVSVMICPKGPDGVDLRYLFKKLAKREIAYLLIEGGSKVIGSAFKARLIDKILIFVAFKVMGDHEAVSAVQGIKITHVAHAIELKNVTLTRIHNDLMVQGYVCRNR